MIWLLDSSHRMKNLMRLSPVYDPSNCIKNNDCPAARALAAAVGQAQLSGEGLRRASF